MIVLMQLSSLPRFPPTFARYLPFILSPMFSA